MELLVSTNWLESALDEPGLRVVDASYHVFQAGRDPKAEYLACHIPGAQFLDLASLRDCDNPLPLMMPPPDYFIQRMRSLGLSRDCPIVLYDNSVHRTSARAWWMMRAFGWLKVAILDGGFAKWLAESRPVQIGPVDPVEGASFAAQIDMGAIRSKHAVYEAMLSASEQIVDVRDTPRFQGVEPEPNSMPAGHIPGSINLPLYRLFREDGTWKEGQELLTEFLRSGVDLAKPMIATCGGGLTAAGLVFAAHLISKCDVALYDGSWAEWSSDPAMPKAREVVPE